MLSAAECQDVGNILFDFLDQTRVHNDLDEIIDRFELDPSDWPREASFSGPARMKAIIKNTNGSDKLLEILYWFISNRITIRDSDAISRLNNILEPKGYTIVTDTSTPRLIPIDTTSAIAEQRQTLSWLESHMNPRTKTHIETVDQELSSGHPKQCLDECRQALESMTTTGQFSQALQEIVNAGLIHRGPNNRQMDYELLYAIYGFCSTYGSHTRATGPDPNSEQARLGLMLTRQSICFILRLIDEARSHGTNLFMWA